MRNVLRSSSECFHFWANNSQISGRASNVSFDDGTLYSYGRHFAIARHLPDGAVAFTTRRYSVTTSQHVSSAKQACRHLRIVLCNDPADSARANMTHARNLIGSLLTQAQHKGIRQTTRDRLKAEALLTAEQANAYLFALPADESEGQYEIDTSSLEAIREQLEAIAEAQAKLAREQQAARMGDLRESLALWRTHAVLIRTGLHSIPPALRMSLEGDEVQTSHGAAIPVADALMLWPIILRCRAGARDFAPGTPIGAYRLTRIRADGSLVVGCHDIAFTEIEAIAQTLGLTSPAIA